jgi:NAD(P)-dependent dehydrogenase (short-subunit alcohol dehydrogenase family)
MKLDMTGKRFIVTGASSGIGAASARLLAESGAEVLAVSRRADPTLFTDLGSVEVLSADLAAEDSATVIISAASAGGAAIDGIVNAGGHFSHAPILEATAAELDGLWRVHVRTPYLLTQQAIPHLTDGSALVFVSSTVVRAGFAPYAAYTAVKGAVDAMARSLAIELAPRTRVNTLMPGFTATPMMSEQYATVDGLEGAIVARTPLGHIGGPEYAANVVGLLLSDDSGYTTASTVVVDGGWVGQGWQSA